MFEDVFMMVIGVGAIIFGLIGTFGFSSMIRADARWALRFGGQGHLILSIVANLMLLLIAVLSILLWVSLLMRGFQ